jgi:hypothetical protein
MTNSEENRKRHGLRIRRVVLYKHEHEYRKRFGMDSESDSGNGAVLSRLPRRPTDSEMDGQRRDT